MPFETTIPKVDAAEAVALASTVETLAQGYRDKKLEPPLDERVKERLQQLGKARDGVAEVLVKQPGAPLPREAKGVDQQVDVSWRATFFFATAWALQTVDPKKSAAGDELLREIFPTGLAFTQGTYPKQWAEGQTRLQKISENHLEGHFRLLHGAELLQGLRVTHEAYGKVLGITDASQLDKAERPTVRAPYEALLEAMRKYIVALNAWGDDGELAQKAAGALYAPFEQARQANAASSAPAPVEPPEPSSVDTGSAVN